MNEFSTNHLVFFSPTHTSAKIARAIGEGIGMGRRIETDLTLDESDSPIEINDSLTVIAAPVYGGRVAPVALQRIKRLKGNNSPAIVVVVYGNRDYEDALLELRDTVASLGFTPLSAGAFIGEHSYSTAEMPVAARCDRFTNSPHIRSRQFEKTGKSNAEFRSIKHTDSFPASRMPVKSYGG